MLKTPQIYIKKSIVAFSIRCSESIVIYRFSTLYYKDKISDAKFSTFPIIYHHLCGLATQIPL